MRKVKQNEVPKHCKHKPIFVVNDYEKIDGKYKNNSDVIGLSIGKAQWRSDGFEPSVKVWRDEKQSDGSYRISRQSEETTLTRALDMASLILKVYHNYILGKGEKMFFIEKNVFGSIELEEYDENLKKQFISYINDNKKEIEEHINLLLETVKDFTNKKD